MSAQQTVLLVGGTGRTGLVNSLFAPASTNMANVAHLMCELVSNQQAWDEWKGKLPVIINETAAKNRSPG
ncbi:MAG TPA: hypothetical protein VJ860_06880 [Polyangia bacterium]|jgi:hypothetical protein|nr:hypothetical protein [Polyangia bacterium]